MDSMIYLQNVSKADIRNSFQVNLHVPQNTQIWIISNWINVFLGIYSNFAHVCIWSGFRVCGINFELIFRLMSIFDFFLMLRLLLLIPRFFFLNASVIFFNTMNRSEADMKWFQLFRAIQKSFETFPGRLMFIYPTGLVWSRPFDFHMSFFNY